MNIRHQLSLDEMFFNEIVEIKKNLSAFGSGELFMNERIFLPHQWKLRVLYTILKPTSCCFLYTPPKLFVISDTIYKFLWKTCKVSSFAQSHQFSTNSPYATHMCYCNMLYVKHDYLKLCCTTQATKHNRKFKFYKVVATILCACDINNAILF